MSHTIDGLVCPAEPRPGGGSILLVGHDPEIGPAVASALGPLTDRVVHAGGGGEALLALSQGTYALVLLAFRHPAIDGFDTARLIRSRTGPVPMIFIAALEPDAEEARIAYALGAADYLSAGVAPEVLRAKAQAFLDLADRTEQAAYADAERYRNQFVAMLAHELRNPLASVAAGLELMDRVTHHDQQLSRTHGVMNRQVQHLTRMLDDLLDTLRITQGKFELRREIVDLARVATQALESCGRSLERHGHEVVLSGGRVLVDADPIRLTQVLVNLLSNADRFTDPGGRIELWWRASSDRALIGVRDNGVGIPAELAPRVFEMFVQERPLSGGLGLGLTLVRQLVNMHDGTVTLRSGGPGKGTEVELSLPLAASVPLLVLQADEPLARPLRIALVEDDVDVRDTMRSLLELWGHHVLEADSGPAAVELLTCESVDIALLDLGLPGYDGYEAARRITEALTDGARPPLVALSGYGRPTDVVRSSEAGFDAHLVKPVAAGTLKSLLARLSE
jgi:signal transduction histidine kinase